MAAIPRDLILRQKAKIRAPYDRTAGEAKLLSDIEAGIPDWTPEKGVALRAALPLIAEAGFVLVELANANIDARLLPHAEGDDLIDIGLSRYTPPKAGEDPDDYRVRIANATGRLYPVTLPDYVQFVSDYNTDIVDVQPTRNPNNNQEMWIYALKANNTDLTTQEMTNITNHFSEEENKIGSATGVVCKAVTHTAFTIAIEVQHYDDVSGDILVEYTRQNIYDWLSKGPTIGQGVYQSKVRGFATQIAGVENAVLTLPATDLAATKGTIYECSANTTDVVITSSVIT